MGRELKSTKHFFKTSFLIMLISIMALMLAGCGESAKLSEDFDESTVESSAKNVIELLNAKDYDGAVQTFNDEMKTALPAETLEKSVSGVIEAAGSFDEFGSCSVIGQKADNSDEDMAVAVIAAKYSKSSVTYTISFDKDMQVAGLYLK